MRSNRTKQKLFAKQNVWGVFMQLPSPELDYVRLNLRAQRR